MNILYVIFFIVLKFCKKMLLGISILYLEQRGVHIAGSDNYFTYLRDMKFRDRLTANN